MTYLSYAKVLSAYRLGNTTDGNPRYRVSLHHSDGRTSSHLTGPNISLAGRIENSEYRTDEHTFILSNDNVIRGEVV